MRVLHLGPDSPIIATVASHGDRVTSMVCPIDDRDAEPFDFIVSYGYRHILRKPLLDLFPGRAINLHISYLPWNRGADPNLWSWIDGTPKGVTIHHIDEGVDTGDIIAQRQVTFGPDETLATSYAKLKAEIESLFAAWWPVIRAGRAPRVPQPPGGSVHRVRDRQQVQIPDGWNTLVASLAASPSQWPKTLRR